MDYQLGQKVTITQVLKRKSEYRKENETDYRSTRHKFWMVVNLKKPREVMIVGVRTLSNGTTQYDSETGNLYDPKEYFKALLVTGTLREKPFYTNLV